MSASGNAGSTAAGLTSKHLVKVGRAGLNVDDILTLLVDLRRSGKAHVDQFGRCERWCNAYWYRGSEQSERRQREKREREASERQHAAQQMDGPASFSFSTVPSAMPLTASKFFTGAYATLSAVEKPACLRESQCFFVIPLP